MCKTSDWIYYFGYGSLVNRDTRPTGEFAVSARLFGWRRVWGHRTSDSERELQGTSLSIDPLASPDAGAIDGVIARMPATDLAILDERETGYERLELPAADFLTPTDVDIKSVYVYRSLPLNRLRADEQHPILQSYVDCVLEGYRCRFGEDGLMQMIDTTDGWDGPLLNDREKPHYPRAVYVDALWQDYYDKLINQKTSTIY